jgi:hypothetical protein
MFLLNVSCILFQTNVDWSHVLKTGHFFVSQDPFMHGIKGPGVEVEIDI